MHDEEYSDYWDKVVSSYEYIDAHDLGCELEIKHREEAGQGVHWSSVVARSLLDHVLSHVRWTILAEQIIAERSLEEQS